MNNSLQCKNWYKNIVTPSTWSEPPAVHEAALEPVEKHKFSPKYLGWLNYHKITNMQNFVLFEPVLVQDASICMVEYKKDVKNILTRI